MKIYLAGSCSIEQRTFLKKASEEIQKIFPDASVYCPFNLKIPNAWEMTQEEWSKKVFEADIKAINQADLIILFSPGRESTAGTNWEQGYAYALNKKIIVFQYTNNQTSLMTYCGCNYFFNIRSIEDVGIILKNFHYNRKFLCENILT